MKQSFTYFHVAMIEMLFLALNSRVYSIANGCEWLLSFIPSDSS